MKSYVPGWTTLAERPAVLIKDYAFGAGRANAMAVALPDGRWLIVSPPNVLDSSEVEAFRASGSVAALLANNGSHYLGLGPFGASFPEASTYAAPRAAARIRKKRSDAGSLTSIASLEPLLGEAIKVSEVDGDKIGDVLVHVRTERGNVLYASDFFANLPELPKNLLFRLLFKLSDSAPGLKLFGMFFRLFVADRQAALRSLESQIELHAPTILVPAHGDVVERNDLVPVLIQLLRAAR